MSGRDNNDAYSRLDFDGPIHHDDSDDDETGPLAQQHRQSHIPVAATSPVMDPRYRTPSPAHALAGYQLEEPPYRPQRQNTGGYPAGSAQMPGDTLAYQPSYSVTNLEHSFNTAPPGPPSRTGHRQSTNYSQGLYPEGLRDNYSADPYEPHPPDHTYPLTQYTTHHDDYHDDDDRRPILEPDSPHRTPGDASYFPRNIPSPVSSAPTPGPGLRRWKTVKKVELFRGNLVLDCPVPNKLLGVLPSKAEREFTHMRYSAATCDPSENLVIRSSLL
ncbi:hypothetical protein HOY82DRAFT_486700 [Tuber indicum]|nr:hypothetical protein HOY82DRAFT_486700 [Tuber indicum]